MGQTPEGAPIKIVPPYSYRRSLIDSAPDITLPRAFFEQTASWSSQDNRPITLGELISSRFPTAAQKLGIPYFDTTTEPVKLAAELNENELREVTCVQLTVGKHEIVTTIRGKSYSQDDLVQEVKEGTDVGQRMVANHKRSMILLEQLIEKGKLTGITDEQPEEIKLPEFPF